MLRRRAVKYTNIDIGCVWRGVDDLAPWEWEGWQMKLTASMVIEYQKKARNCKKIKDWKALGREIRDRHNLTDREAISILNGWQDDVLKIIANQEGK